MAASPNFAELLSRRVVLGDGAMGTMLYQYGVFLNSCFDELNISNPELVKKVHRGYVQAGVDFIETNTIGANDLKLGKYGLAEKVVKIKKQLIKRQRIDNLKGQHNAWVQGALTQEPPQFKSVEEAVDHIKRIQKFVYEMTSGYYVPGSLMCGLYENTAYFRFGDTSRPEHTPYKVVIRGGGLDYEDPGTMYSPTRGRYPADYTFRLIDVVVKIS